MSSRIAGDGMIPAYQKAEAMFRQALKKNGESPDLLAQLGKCVALQGRTDEALELFLSSLEMNPAQPILLLRTGDLYFSQGCYEEAMRFYEHYERLRPERARGYARMGDCLLAQGYIWSAADAYSLAVDRDPDDPGLRRQLQEMMEICLSDI